VSDPLAGGHAGESPYQYDPAARLSLTAGYSRDPLHDSRYPWWVPPCNRCAWSLEIVRERTREIERTRQLFVTIDAAIARGEALRGAQALYRAQRRQALTAIIGGLLVMILVIAAAV
jgi:hypothetical protein